jgi:DNA polymerase III epsilon subunit-like protein
LIRPIEEPFIDWCRSVVASGEYVFMDTETTGFYGEVIDLAIVDSKGHQLYNKLLRPLGVIPEEATKVHNISTAMVANAPMLIDEWYEICAIVGGRTVITYNAKFDSERITYSLRKHRMHLCPQCSWIYECAMLGYAEFYGAPPMWEGAGPAWQKLGEGACYQQGIMLPPDLHRAMPDVQATRALICKIAATGEASPRYGED